MKACYFCEAELPTGWGVMDAPHWQDGAWLRVQIHNRATCRSQLRRAPVPSRKARRARIRTDLDNVAAFIGAKKARRS